MVYKLGLFRGKQLVKCNQNYLKTLKWNCLNSCKKIQSYQFRKFQCGNKMVIRWSYLHIGKFQRLQKMTSLWLNDPKPLRLLTIWLTLLVLKLAYSGRTWLLMPWLLAALGLLQLWYWQCRIDRSLFSTRKDLYGLCQLGDKFTATRVKI